MPVVIPCYPSGRVIPTAHSLLNASLCFTVTPHSSLPQAPNIPVRITCLLFTLPFLSLFLSLTLVSGVAKILPLGQRARMLHLPISDNPGKSLPIKKKNQGEKGKWKGRGQKRERMKDVDLTSRTFLSFPSVLLSFLAQWDRLPMEVGRRLSACPLSVQLRPYVPFVPDARRTLHIDKHTYIHTSISLLFGVCACQRVWRVLLEPIGMILFPLPAEGKGDNERRTHSSLCVCVCVVLL